MGLLSPILTISFPGPPQYHSSPLEVCSSLCASHVSSIPVRSVGLTTSAMRMVCATAQFRIQSSDVDIKYIYLAVSFFGAQRIP